jgi:hypothetical protein
MDLRECDVRVSGLKKQLTRLLTSEAVSIGRVLADKPNGFAVSGVYAISTPADDEIVYVGKTRTKPIIGRLADHRSLDTKSDLRGMLKIHSDYPQQINEYVARCLCVVDDRQRTFLEHFCIGVVQPRFNK